jgi:glycosyltransferase involved in cell wall biosynthesis
MEEALMPRLSILTAAYGPSATYLAETAASIHAQELPTGWDLEWIVQEDGDTPRLADLMSAEGPVSYVANGLQLGIGSTRNLALSRATGDLVQVLDHDDVLLPGALAILIQKFEQHPIHWAVSAADDLLEDGTRKSWDSALPFGIVPAGAANQWAEEHEGNWPVHCAGLMMRTELLRTLGGWGGTPVDDDIVLFAALSEMSDGWNEETVTWLYRQHPGQTTRSTTGQRPGRA